MSITDPEFERFCASLGYLNANHLGLDFAIVGGRIEEHSEQRPEFMAEEERSREMAALRHHIITGQRATTRFEAEQLHDKVATPEDPHIELNAQHKQARTETGDPHSPVAGQENTLRHPTANSRSRAHFHGKVVQERPGFADELRALRHRYEAMARAKAEVELQKSTADAELSNALI